MDPSSTKGHIQTTLFKGLVHLNPRQYGIIALAFARWAALGAGVGVLSGIASALFLALLNRATQIHQAAPWLLVGLPLAGIVTNLLYTRLGGASVLGNNLIIDELHQSKQPVPLRMAPLVLFATVITHVFGGSAGREGTAVQMGGALAERLAGLLRLSKEDRRILLMTGISGGFGAVFGTPLAGAVFGLEVQQVGRIRYDGLVPCLAAAIVGDWVTRWVGVPLGVTHSVYPVLPVVALEPVLLAKVILAGIVFGACSILFIEWTHAVSTFLNRIVGPRQWLKSALGACGVIALTGLMGTQAYNGLSLPLLHTALEGTDVATLAFLLKLILTGITIGAGFKGGEVTPLFVIGATLGYTLGGLLGVSPHVMGALGFVAVFAGAANTPLACAIMGVELFGSGAFSYLFVAVVVSYIFSGHRSIYSTQRLDTPKYMLDVPRRLSVRDWMRPAPNDSEVTAPSISMRASLQEAARLMVNQVLTQLSVVNDRSAQVGILDENAILQGLVGQAHLQTVTPTLTAFGGSETRVRAWMHAGTTASTNADSILAEAPLVEAMRLMLDHAVAELAVVDAADHVLGVITRQDVLRAVGYSAHAPAAAESPLAACGL